MLIAFRCIVSISIKLRLDMLEHHGEELLLGLSVSVKLITK